MRNKQSLRILSLSPLHTVISYVIVSNILNKHFSDHKVITPKRQAVACYNKYRIVELYAGLKYYYYLIPTTSRKGSMRLLSNFSRNLNVTFRCNEKYFGEDFEKKRYITESIQLLLLYLSTFARIIILIHVILNYSPFF